MKTKTLFVVAFLLSIVFFALGLSANPQPATISYAQDEGPIRIGSKTFTENILLAKMMVIALQNAGYDVVDLSNYGDTPIVREALEFGLLDGYPEYTGTAYTSFFFEYAPELSFQDPLVKDERLSFGYVSSMDAAYHDIIWLQPAPANNTYALVVRREFAEEHGLVTLEDFASFVNRGGDVYLVANDNFMFRPDGLPAFEISYGFNLDGTQLLTIPGVQPAETERALRDGVNGITVSWAFATDAVIDEYDLVVLEDNRFAQPLYLPAPTFRGEVIRANPNIPLIINRIFATLDDATLRGLNQRVDVNGEDVDAVALSYLVEKGFVPDPNAPPPPTPAPTNTPEVEPLATEEVSGE